jgi:hypothetical protein
MVSDEQKAASKPLVERGATSFAKIEDDIKGEIEEAKVIDGVLNAIRDLGIISDFDCYNLKKRNRAIYIAHEAEVLDFHGWLVHLCKGLGIDVPPPNNPDLPQPQSGGGSR